MAFQPIVDVRSRRVFAYEALVRGDNGESAASVFANVRPNALHAFDQACRETALNTAAQLGFVSQDAALSMNFLPNAIYDPLVCFEPTLQTAAQHGVAPARIIFEINESEAVANPDHLALIVEANRAVGWKTALDDFGARHSNLEPGLVAPLR
jgi:EAL domain-containing protein (putative c-di-GMP-specific phosphodiesterase class I)